MQRLTSQKQELRSNNLTAPSSDTITRTPQLQEFKLIFVVVKQGARRLPPELTPRSGQSHTHVPHKISLWCVSQALV